VRLHLVAATRALAAPVPPGGQQDPVIAALADVDSEELLHRRRRLAAALTDFDAATIATTHQFCLQVLVGLGIAGDSEPGAVLLDDVGDLVDEVASDLYLKVFSTVDQRPGLSPTDVRDLIRSAVGDPRARLEPQEAPPGSTAMWRRRFAEQAREQVDGRKRRAGLLSYDDLLTQVADALDTSDDAARDRMRQRWRVVLVDEFQDTDPVQWDVLRRAFDGHARLVLIGDPKQAVYAFRGGDVVTYLHAAGTAGAASTLARNWRTDARLVDALQVLMRGLQLGDPEIVVRPVSAAAPADSLAGGPGRLQRAPVTAPLRVRQVRRAQLGSTGRMPYIGPVRDLVVDDLVGDIVGLLAAGASFDGEPVGPGDIAVLVNTHQQAAQVATGLAGQRVPSVVAGPGSVFATAAGEDWVTLLDALEQPHRATAVRAAALTPFVGRTAAELDAGGERLLDDLSATMRRWATLLADRGVAAVLEAATVERRLWPRLLARPDGERRLTDLRHVGEAMHAAALAGDLGPAAQLEWLRRRRTEGQTERIDDRARRLDSDAAAVEIVTLHASKGLEYPVVYLPFAFDRWVGQPNFPLLHDETGSRVRDVGGPDGPGWADRVAAEQAEQAGEQLRLLYVGLTRAKSQVVTWWAPSFNTATSALHRVLFGRPPGSEQPDLPDEMTVPDDDVATARLLEWQRVGAIVVEPAEPGRALPTPPIPPPTGPMDVAIFDRPVDLGWRRTSYSALTAGVGHGSVGVAGVGSEPETTERDDEALPEGASVDIGSAEGRATDDVDGTGSDGWSVSPMAGLPGGTGFGTLVHAVFEEISTDVGDDRLAAEVRARAAEQLVRHPTQAPLDELSAALVGVLRTPLGPLAAGLSLAELPDRDRLAELDFELPLAGGDTPTSRVRLGQVADLLDRHLAGDDPLADYPAHMRVPELADQPLRGYLTGSIDVVLRLPGPRYLIVDYKTNRLGDPDQERLLTVGDYRPGPMAAAMIGANYPLQALLYSVALHRFLRWRQPGYDPGLHLGGALYLFVRGMAGPETPLVDGTPCGVFGWRPSGSLVSELSALLDGSTS